MDNHVLVSENVQETARNMMIRIHEAGDRFYQYRSCRSNEDVIYDIENIRHKVFYAQTPLNMNDPFDSAIGFSKEQFYNEIIDTLVKCVSPDETTKELLSFLLKQEMLGKIADMLQLIKSIRRYIRDRQKKMHQMHVPTLQFVKASIDYSHAPRAIKEHCSALLFPLLACIAAQLHDNSITSESIESISGLSDILGLLRCKIAEAEDLYQTQYRNFLSKITVTCLSNSGWDNQLMWAHYADAYHGMCIEYDFSGCNYLNYMFFPIQYSTERPTISLRDLGISFWRNGSKVELIHEDVDISTLVSKLLLKNECWNYENEWRVIEPCNEPFTPQFPSTPPIRSITFGPNIKSIYKQELMDICFSEGIECYDLQPSVDRYHLERKLIDENDIFVDIGSTMDYITRLCNHMSVVLNRVKPMVDTATQEILQCKPVPNFSTLFVDTKDALIDAAFLSKALHRFYKHTNTAEIKALLSIPNTEFAFTSIGNFLTAAQTLIANTEKSMFGLLLRKIISKDQYQTVKMLLLNTHELLDKSSFEFYPEGYLPNQPSDEQSTL